MRASLVLLNLGKAAMRPTGPRLFFTLQNRPGVVLQTEAPENSQIRAEVDRVSYRNEENGWTVLKARVQGREDLVTATGHFAAIRPGDLYEMFGTWGKHPQYGAQFKVDRIVPIRPKSAAAIERYLSSGLIKGIGPKTASRIVEHFGDDTLDILDASPQRLMEIPSIGGKKAEAILASWGEQRSVADVMLFLNTHGISPLFASRIFKIYGPQAIEMVSADPYRLAVDIHGIGFLSADRIAQSMGIAPDSQERMRAAILYLLQQGEERGHCYVTTPQLLGMLADALKLPEEKIVPRLADCLGHLNDLGAIVSEPKVNDEGDKETAHYRADLIVAEWNIAHSIQRLLAKPLEVDQARLDGWIARYTEVSGTALSPEQMNAVRTAASHRVFILTGGPGVGKTTTANTIIRLLKAMGKTVALGAPTGRAAQRLTEVAATPARTIHRMLEWLPAVGNFTRDENNPLTVQAVIIDESSMLDVRLADALVRAVPDTAQLILIGDVDQLPSVGPGNVLRDLIDSGRVPTTRLTEIFRQAASSVIVRAAHSINHGQFPDPAELTMEAKSDCLFIDADTAEDVKGIIKHWVTKKLPRDFKFDPVVDCQILTPMNRGELGTQAFNEELQALLNPGGPNIHEFKRGHLILRPGDKVIQSANNYDLGVFNGDIGFIRQTKVEGGKLLVSFGDDRLVTYEDEDVMDLKLAYAITIHKSQGSEFPVVIIPASMQHYVMLQRNLMYTALTRARKLAIFIGSKKALSYAISNQSSGQRQTSLVDRLRQAGMPG